MKDIRFYLEYPTEKDKREATRKELGNHCGTVVAVYYENRIIGEVSGRIELLYDGIAGTLYTENSPVCFTSVAQSYLNLCCKRISEKQAREIHPALFERLDN